ncbi:hypothetical protein ABIA38_007586 [Embleya sp. AB8]
MESQEYRVGGGGLPVVVGCLRLAVEIDGVREAG